MSPEYIYVPSKLVWYTHYNYLFVLLLYTGNTDIVREEHPTDVMNDKALTYLSADISLTHNTACIQIGQGTVLYV